MEFMLRFRVIKIPHCINSATRLAPEVEIQCEREAA